MVSSTSSTTDIDFAEFNPFIQESQKKISNLGTILHYSIELEYQHRGEKGWLVDSTSKHVNVSREQLPEEDLELWNMMKEKILGVPQEQWSPESAAKVADFRAWSQLSFESAPVQAAVRAFRESVASDDPVQNLEAECREVFDAYQQVIEEKRLIKKKVEVIYRNAEGHETSQVFEKNYARQCNTDTCKKWRTSAHKLQKCARCHMVYYCNREHQKKDWRQHKPNCKEKEIKK